MQPLRRTLNTGERPPYISSHSSRIKSKQGANRRSIITKANIQKALSVSALLRHPLPLQPPSLALVLPPSLHPTPPSSVRLPPPLPPLALPSLVTAPTDAFPPSLPSFFLSIKLSLSLSLSVVLSSLHTVLLSRCPSSSYTYTYPPTPLHTHTQCSFFLFF